MLALNAHTCNCVLPHRKNSKHTRDSFRGKCSMNVPSFFTATAYRSEELFRTPTPLQPSPPILFYIRGSREWNFFRKTFPWQLLSPYVLPNFYVVKIFVLKYFRRMSTLRTFFNTKIFPTKISHNKNFHYMEIIQLYVLIVFNLVVHSIYQIKNPCQHF